MSEKINDGGPAFPLATSSGSNTAVNGMALRDWMASQEHLEDCGDRCYQVAEALGGPRPSGNWQTNTMEFLLWEAKCRAALKYIRADAMLKARAGE